MRKVLMAMAVLVAVAGCSGSSSDRRPDGSGVLTVTGEEISIGEVRHAFDGVSGQSAIVAGGSHWQGDSLAGARLEIEWAGDVPVSASTASGLVSVTLYLAGGVPLYFANAGTAEALQVDVGARNFGTAKGDPTSVTLDGQMAGPDGPAAASGVLTARRR